MISTRIEITVFTPSASSILKDETVIWTNTTSVLHCTEISIFKFPKQALLFSIKATIRGRHENSLRSSGP